MSIRNARTGRHEDDLYAELVQNDGQVTLQHLIEHLNECIVEVPEAFGSNVTAPVKMATMILEGCIAEGILDPNGHVRL